MKRASKPLDPVLKKCRYEYAYGPTPDGCEWDWYLEGVRRPLLLGQGAARDAQDGEGVDPHADHVAARGRLAQAHQLLRAHALGGAGDWVKKNNVRIAGKTTTTSGAWQWTRPYR